MSEDKKPNILTDIEECFKRIEKLENELTVKKYMEQNLREACSRIEKLEDNHLDKLSPEAFIILKTRLDRMEEENKKNDKFFYFERNRLEKKIIILESDYVTLEQFRAHRNLNAILEEKMDKLESHVSKLHVLINLEDRITACDVLNRLTILEKGEMSLRLDKDMVKLDYAVYIELHKRISALEEIETNLTTRIGVLGRALNCLSEENEKLRNSVKKKCHICHGKDLCFPHCVKRESNIS